MYASYRAEDISHASKEYLVKMLTAAGVAAVVTGEEGEGHKARVLLELTLAEPLMDPSVIMPQVSRALMASYQSAM
jgi:hypothetical protein